MKLNLWSEYRSRILWYFMAFAFGCAVYFGLPFEPNLWVLVAIGCVWAGMVFWKKSCWLKIIGFLILGLMVATIHTHLIHTERMLIPKWNCEVEGTVVNVFPQPEKQIIILDDINMQSKGYYPKKVRLKYLGKTPEFHIHDKIKVRAQLFGPFENQVIPFYYDGIEAQGKILEILNHIPYPENQLNYIRRYIMNRLWSLLPAKQAQIAIPLIVGEQKVVSQKLYETYRKAGIAHVLSVSGFHMVLLAGFVFFLIRSLLACFPGIALRISTKKVAAVIAFGVTLLYLLLSGQQVPALRAFLMISAVFLGILTNRKTVSLYTLMLVGFVVLMFRPELILSISFQLSFVAVMVLVGVFDALKIHITKMRLLECFIAAIIANILVTVALAPFIVYHFNQFNPYGILGNLVTSIFFSVLVMPLLFLGTIFMPFGWDAPILKWAGFVLEKITDVAEKIANLPHAEIIVPSFSPIGLGVISFGLAMICLLRTRIRWIGIIVMIFGLGMGYMTMTYPDILVANRAKIIAVHQTGQVYVKTKRKRSIDLQRWMHQFGLKRFENLNANQIEIKDKKIALSVDACQNADLAILPKQTKDCGAKQVFVPGKYETYNIYVDKNIQIVGNLSVDENRPWGVKRKGTKK